MIDNMRMVYEEISERLRALGILSREEIARQQELLGALPPEGLPPAWGSYRVVGEV
jgi:hypothetical protein